jgi:hydroxyethylthiazole kinase-like uncharacterized protein yjeF
MPEPIAVSASTLRDWPLPGPGDDKEQRGRVLVVGGTATTPGAVLLAAEATLRAGAGKLVVATAAGVAPDVACRLPEAQVHGLPETASGSIAPGAAERLLEIAGAGGTVLVGPGFTDPEESAALLEALLPGLGGTVVLDALATAYLTPKPERLTTLEASCIVTANPKELGKSLGRDGASTDPCDDSAELARRTGAVVLCGGTDKVVADPEGTLWQVGAGGPGLGVSGSGDVQAGIVTGLAARGAAHPQAAVWGGFLHGEAGERLAARVGPVGFLARELPAEVPAILAGLGS